MLLQKTAELRAEAYFANVLPDTLFDVLPFLPCSVI